jgi:hypothetical protein
MESAIISTFEMLTERITKLEECLESFVDRNEREKVYATRNGMFMLSHLPRIPILVSALDYSEIVIKVEFTIDPFGGIWQNKAFRDFASRIAPDLQEDGTTSDHFHDHLDYLSPTNYLLSRFCSDRTSYDLAPVTVERGMYIRVKEGIHHVYDMLVTGVPMLLKSLSVPLQQVREIAVFNAVHNVDDFALRCALDILGGRHESLKKYVMSLNGPIKLDLSYFYPPVRDARGHLVLFKRNVLDQIVRDSDIDFMLDMMVVLNGNPRPGEWR